MDFDDETKKILDEYSKRLDKNSNISFKDVQTDEVFSREYEIFRNEMLGKKTTIYENLCNFSERIVKIKPKPI